MRIGERRFARDVIASWRAVRDGEERGLRERKEERMGRWSGANCVTDRRVSAHDEMKAIGARERVGEMPRPPWAMGRKA